MTSGLTSASNDASGTRLEGILTPSETLYQVIHDGAVAEQIVPRDTVNVDTDVDTDDHNGPVVTQRDTDDQNPVDDCSSRYYVKSRLGQGTVGMVMCADKVLFDNPSNNPSGANDSVAIKGAPTRMHWGYQLPCSPTEDALRREGEIMAHVKDIITSPWLVTLVEQGESTVPLALDVRIGDAQTRFDDYENIIGSLLQDIERERAESGKPMSAQVQPRPNPVRVQERLPENKTTPWLVMTLADLGSWEKLGRKDLLRGNGSHYFSTAGQIIATALDAFEGLAALHKADVAHRDLRWGNLFVKRMNGHRVP